MKILVVSAHPEATSVTRQLADISVSTLVKQDHQVMESDLYAMNWKAVYDASDFPERVNNERLSFIQESAHAYSNGCQTTDVTEEQRKLAQADAVILHFPLWWFSMPAIMKGWIDRVWAYGLAYGYKDAGNRYRYGEGGLAGKRALLAVSVGGPAVDYGPRGINGPLDQLLFPITHGTLFFAGMDVLPEFALYSTGAYDSEAMAAGAGAWRERLAGLFTDAPVPFRRQNDGDYPDRHVLSENILTNQRGLTVHTIPGSREH